MPANELQQWLADRDRQRSTQRGIRGFAREWNATEERQRVERLLTDATVAGAEAMAERVRLLFADDGWIDSLIDRLAARVREDRYFDPPFAYLNSELQSGLVLVETPLVSVALGVSSAVSLATRKTAARARTSVAFPGRLLVLKFIKAGGARISLWEAERITGDFTAARAGRCRRVGERQLVDGDVITVDGRHQSYVVEQARSNLVILQAEIAADQAPLSVEYDSATHEYVGCSATDDSASRIQMMTTLLRKLGCDRAFATIAGFLDHRDFFVRWHVMKELLGIDAEAALPHLMRMAARDPHPDTRRAARITLDRIEAPQPERRAA